MSVERFQDFLRFAIEQERRWGALYEEYARASTSGDTRRLFDMLVGMEREHEEKLMMVLESGSLASLEPGGSFADMRLGDYLVEEEVPPGASLEQILAYAIKAEQKAYELYAKLASLESEPHVKELLGSLAAEELGHKRDLEERYRREFTDDG